MVPGLRGGDEGGLEPAGAVLGGEADGGFGAAEEIGEAELRHSSRGVPADGSAAGRGAGALNSPRLAGTRANCGSAHRRVTWGGIGATGLLKAPLSFGRVAARGEAGGAVLSVWEWGWRGGRARSSRSSSQQARRAGGCFSYLVFLT